MLPAFCFITASIKLTGPLLRFRRCPNTRRGVTSALLAGLGQAGFTQVSRLPFPSFVLSFRHLSFWYHRVFEKLPRGILSRQCHDDRHVVRVRDVPPASQLVQIVYYPADCAAGKCTSRLSSFIVQCSVWSLADNKPSDL